MLAVESGCELLGPPLVVDLVSTELGPLAALRDPLVTVDVAVEDEVTEFFVLSAGFLLSSSSSNVALSCHSLRYCCCNIILKLIRLN